MSNISIILDVKKDIIEKIINKINIMSEIENCLFDFINDNEEDLTKKIEKKLVKKNDKIDYLVNLISKDIKEDLIKKVENEFENKRQVNEYILNLITEDVKKSLIKKIEIKLDNKNCIDEYLFELINKNINSKIYFSDGIHFDYEKQKLFNKSKQILFTRLEYKLFRYLLNNLNKLVTIEQLKTFVWKDENTTRFTIRNFIKRIRDKTYKDLIVCKSNCGYILVSNKSNKEVK